MIYSVRQVQEKCCEPQKPLYMAYMDLTKAFELVSRSGLFSPLEKKAGCPPRMFQMVRSFHEYMHRTVFYDYRTSTPFP